MFVVSSNSKFSEPTGAGQIWRGRDLNAERDAFENEIVSLAVSHEVPILGFAEGTNFCAPKWVQTLLQLKIM